MTDKEAKKRGLQKCKYIEKLGVKTTDYFTNFSDNTDERYKKWMKERKKYGFDSRETWNLDRILVEWFYTRFKMYLEVTIVDLENYTFDFTDDDGNKKKVTQREAINIVIDYCEKWFKEPFIDKEFFPKNIWDLIGEIMPAMWW